MKWTGTKVVVIENVSLWSKYLKWFLFWNGVVHDCSNLVEFIRNKSKIIKYSSSTISLDNHSIYSIDVKILSKLVLVMHCFGTFEG
jgi:hypothetical protein